MPVYNNKGKTKDGRCWYFKTNYVDEFGLHHQKNSKKYATKSEAKDAERAFLNKLDEDKNAKYCFTFRDLYNKFYEHQKTEVCFTTLRDYKYKQRHLEFFMDKKCEDYSWEMFEEWKKIMNYDKQLSTRTKNDTLKFWKSILNYGMDWYDLDFRKAYKRMTNFNNPNELPKEMETYCYEEFKQFLSAEKDLRWIVIWKILYFCGLRLGELRGLTWKSVDFKKKVLKINKQIQDYSLDQNVESKTRWYFTTPKTKNSNRVLPICDSLYEDLKKYYNIVSQARNFNENFFVAGVDGGIEPIAKSTVRMHSLSIQQKSNSKHIRIHDFRHSCASLLINSGASVTMVAKYLGHTKIDETLNTYSHLFQGALDSVINIINTLNEENKTDDK